MKTLTVKNLSTFADCSALARAASYLAGDEQAALYNSDGRQVVKIKRRGNTITILDADERDEGGGDV